MKDSIRLVYPALVINDDYCLWFLCMLSLGSFLEADRMARVLFDSESTFSFISETFVVEIRDWR